MQPGKIIHGRPTHPLTSLLPNRTATDELPHTDMSQTQALKKHLLATLSPAGVRARHTAAPPPLAGG